tara:strand:- start:642 stop:965 length:324 start_codon:yes stop_codon:yes gene_type:complete
MYLSTKSISLGKMKVELPKESHPDSDFNVKPEDLFTPKTRKPRTHMSKEFPIATWIDIVEALKIAARVKNPASIQHAAIARELDHELVGDLEPSPTCGGWVKWNNKD